MGHELIIDKNPPDNEGKTPLHDAASDGYTEIVELFLNHKNIMNKLPKCGNGGFTPLHWAVAKGQEKVVEIFLENEMIFDKNPVDNWGTTPLHLAARVGHDGIVKILLNNSKIEDKMPKDVDGETPMHRHSLIRGIFQRIFLYLVYSKVYSCSTEELKNTICIFSCTIQ